MNKQHKIFRLAGNMPNHLPGWVEIAPNHFMTTMDTEDCKCTTEDHRDGTPLIREKVNQKRVTYDEFKKARKVWRKLNLNGK